LLSSFMTRKDVSGPVEGMTKTQNQTREIFV